MNAPSPGPNDALAAGVDETVALYRKAAVHGNPEAQRQLGWILANGLGADKNEGEAVMVSYGRQSGRYRRAPTSRLDACQ